MELDWLKRPVAHRGLHDAKAGIIENAPSAIAAAIEADYAIEVDLQEAACGMPMVFHDYTLDRLTDERGALMAKPASALKKIKFAGTRDRLASLPELLEQVAGTVPLVIEIKSRGGGIEPFSRAIYEHLKDYAGPAVIMSFDPGFLEAFRALEPAYPRGLLSSLYRNEFSIKHVPSALERFRRRHLLAFNAAPHFYAYDVKALPTAATLIARDAFYKPLLTWTVRTKEDRATAARWADAMIFEGFRA